MMRVKPPAVAGLFYPDDPTALHAAIDGYLQASQAGADRRPQAMIVPHAGYVYSGPVAAQAYAVLRPWASQIRRVVVLAPSHRVGFRGIAISSADVFQTPLGEIPVDHEAIAALEDLPNVGRLDAAFAQEHALEVQLPFLQTVLSDFSLIPVVVGDADAEEVERVIAAVRRDDTLIVVSSDLSHYHTYPSCQARDRETTANIEALRGDRIGPDNACGAYPIRGLLQTARHEGWHVKTLDLRNSGDTSGDRSRVVGYGAYVLY